MFADRHNETLSRMPIFSFTISPAGIAQLHDALTCLAKFDENISLEASAHEVGLTVQSKMTADHISFESQA